MSAPRVDRAALSTKLATQEAYGLVRVPHTSLGASGPLASIDITIFWTSTKALQGMTFSP